MKEVMDCVGTQERRGRMSFVKEGKAGLVSREDDVLIEQMWLEQQSRRQQP